jgi:hypothetical protein
MDGHANSGHNALRFRAKVVRIDLNPNGARALSIDVHHGPKRRYRLSERDRRSAMENAKWLPGPVVYGHCGDDALCGELRNLDAEGVG